MEHLIEPSLLERRVHVHLVGVGGNGAQMAACLARLDIAMRALGHPAGLHVIAFDADTVSGANVGRQLYSPADVGQNKAVLTIQRLNLFYGLDWDAVPVRYESWGRSDHADIVVSCVDTRASRRYLHERFVARPGDTSYWLDLGNTESTAQVVLGEALRHHAKERGGCPRLPCVTELFSELLDTTVKEVNAPSCSVRMSLVSQGLFINDVAVRMGSQLLYELFSRGRLRQHGVIINLDGKRSGPIDVSPDVWRRYNVPAPTPTAAKGRTRRRVHKGGAAQI